MHLIVRYLFSNDSKKYSEYLSSYLFREIRKYFLKLKKKNNY